MTNTSDFCYTSIHSSYWDQSHKAMVIGFNFHCFQKLRENIFKHFAVSFVHAMRPHLIFPTNENGKKRVQNLAALCLCSMRVALHQSCLLSSPQILSCCLFPFFFSEINFWSSMNSGGDKLDLFFVADHLMHQGIILRKPIQGIILRKLVCLKFRSAKADLFKTTSCWQICFPTGNIRDKMKTLKCFLGKGNPKAISVLRYVDIS